LLKAASDLKAGERLVAVEGPFDAVCFHAQQACEKALKAVLAFADVEIPRTHNLEELQLACTRTSVGPLPEELATLNLSELTPYAVEARYDAEFWPDAQTAQSAVDVAARLLHLVSAFLNVSS
jgi:HEPN domain-containing protein